MALSGTETIYREELVNANYDGQNYQLNIRAQDMPRGGSGNLAQERIQTSSDILCAQTSLKVGTMRGY